MYGMLGNFITSVSDLLFRSRNIEARESRVETGAGILVAGLLTVAAEKAYEYISDSAGFAGLAAAGGAAAALGVSVIVANRGSRRVKNCGCCPNPPLLDGSGDRSFLDVILGTPVDPVPTRVVGYVHARVVARSHARASVNSYNRADESSEDDLGGDIVALAR